MKASKLLLLGLTAALVLGAAIGTASANRIAMSENHFRTVWGILTFEAGIGFFNVKCPVTMEGSFHSRTLSKVAEQLIGYVTRVEINNAGCTSGHATVLTATLPWHIRYDSFTGTLPTIATIKEKLFGTAFLTEAAGFNCLYEGQANGTLNREAGTGVVRTLTPTGTVPLKTRLASSSFTCPGSGELKGEGENFVQGSSTTRITVTLVQ